MDLLAVAGAVILLVVTLAVAATQPSASLEDLEAKLDARPRSGEVRR